MNYEAYKLSANKNYTRFQFQSIGKRGIFEKVISFRQLSGDIQNLALLDYDPISGEESDMSVTDNGDMPEVLVTVMKATYLFFQKHPDKLVYFKGSSDSRTRLYQISINKVYPEIKNDLLVYGQQNGEWIGFEPNIRFEGFLITKKALT